MMTRRRVVVGSVAASLLIASTASGAPGPPKVAARPVLPEIVSVKVMPTNQVLKRRTLNTVVVKPGFAFKVTLRSTSNAARNVTLRLTFPRVPRTVGSVVKVRTLRVGGNQWKAATFFDLGPIQFAVRTTIKVSVTVKVGDVRQTGSVIYPAIYALG